MKKLLLIGMLALMPILSGCDNDENDANAGALSACEVDEIVSADDIKIRVSDFLKANNMDQVKIKEVKDEENVVYTIIVDVEGQEYTSYASKDGEFFFQVGAKINSEAIAEQQAKTEQAKIEQEKAAEDSLIAHPKADKPTVELFVMSHCPFGTQIEKGILPVVETLGDKIDFQLKFCDYAMHGKKEVDEEINQYCIKTEQNDKLLPYLKCFLKEGKTEECITETGIDNDALQKCITSTDAKYKITESYEDKEGWGGQFPPFAIYAEDNEKYGVKGSPTLVLNGKTISSARDSASLLKTICVAGFNVEPEECKTELSSTNPSTGFGYEESGSGTDATCG